MYFIIDLKENSDLKNRYKKSLNIIGNKIGITKNGKFKFLYKKFKLNWKYRNKIFWIIFIKFK